MKKTIQLLLLTAFAYLPTLAQNNEHLSGFTSISLTYKPNKNWYGYLETQGRSIADFNTIDYYEVKGGAGYNLNSNNQVFLGLGRYATYSKNKLNKEELRFWLQYNYSKLISRLKIEQRFRAEKRFFHNPINGIDTNSERFRYRLNLILPLNNSKVEPKTFFINTYDELFATTDKPTISRNRMYLGAGYQFSKSFGTSLGYLFQREFGNTSNSNFHFIFCGLNFTIDKSKNETPSHVPSPEHD